MRLLVVSQYFWPEDFRINDISRELARRGHAVTVLCGTPNYPSGKVFPGHGWFRRTRETWEGVEIVRVPQVLRGSRSRVRLAANYLSYTLMASLLGPFRCRASYDAILVFQVSPATMGIAAVVNAGNVRTRLALGDLEGARRASRIAARLCWASALVTMVCLLVVILGADGYSAVN